MATEPAGRAYRTLKRTNGAYDAAYWRVLRALYHGGRALLRDDVVMKAIFPSHREESSKIYDERKKRAFYVPYASEIIGHIIAGLSADPLEMKIGTSETKEDAALPDYYQEFFEDTSQAGGPVIPLNQLVTEQMRTAMQTCCTWTLIDFPVVRNSDGLPREYDPTSDSRAEQESDGALAAYAVAIDPECVIDWECDEAGELVWALIHVVKRPRATLDDARTNVLERWRFLTRTSWEQYEITHAQDKEIQDNDIVPLVRRGDHAFGRVPLIPLRMPAGLWAMDKIESLAREHFNKISALGWGVFQSLVPELYEFQGPEDGGKGTPIGGAQEDPNRGTNQKRGAGHVQIRGKDDRAEFIGPDVAPFTEARQACDSLRDDMHRVLHQMALSAANSSSALKRSAESKEMDTAAVAVILDALGEIARQHAEDICNMIARGRADTEMVDEWVASGMEEFDVVATASAIADALSIDALNIESPTFRREHRKYLVRQILGGQVAPEVVEVIDEELETNITDESIAPGAGELATMQQDATLAAAKAKTSQGGGGVPPTPQVKPTPSRAARPGKQPAKPKPPAK